MSVITKEMVEQAKYQELISFCPKLGVKYEYQKKDPLKELLLDKLNSSKTIKPSKTSALPSENKEKKYSKKVFNVLDNEQLTKSDKMRLLFDMGIESPSEISKLTNSHYSFVYTVIAKHKSDS